MKELQPHPLSNTFPMMNDEQYIILRDNIKEIGLKHPIRICNGQIVDGRNRYKACNELGIEPKFLECQESEIETIVFVENIAKRSLTNTQRACVAAEWHLLTKVKNTAERLNDINRRRRAGEVIVTDDSWKKRNAKFARVCGKFNVGIANVGKIITLIRNAPEYYNKVKSGEYSVQLAYRLYREKAGPRPGPGKKVFVYTNIDLSKEITPPSCFESHESIHSFIKSMCAHGWMIDMRIRAHESIPGQCKYFVNVFGNGFPSNHNNWKDCDSEPEFRRAIIVSATSKIHKAKNFKHKAA
jgi:hypothetical protein